MYTPVVMVLKTGSCIVDFRQRTDSTVGWNQPEWAMNSLLELYTTGGRGGGGGGGEGGEGGVVYK